MNHSIVLYEWIDGTRDSVLFDPIQTISPVSRKSLVRKVDYELCPMDFAADVPRFKINVTFDNNLVNPREKDNSAVLNNRNPKQITFGVYFSYRRTTAVFRNIYITHIARRKTAYQTRHQTKEKYVSNGHFLFCPTPR
jgi:hypothetical protein